MRYAEAKLFGCQTYWVVKHIGLSHLFKILLVERFILKSAVNFERFLKSIKR